MTHSKFSPCPRNHWQHNGRVLSGNIKAKLEEAQRAEPVAVTHRREDDDPSPGKVLLVSAIFLAFLAAALLF